MIKYYKVGDKVRIKSIDWYNENKSKIIGVTYLVIPFIESMSKYCGQVATITEVIGGNEYKISLDNGYYDWTSYMFEGLVEEETTPNIIEEEKTYLDNMNIINDERNNMKHFSLEEYLKDPSQKVVTRDGRAVRIICTDFKNQCPIIVIITNKAGIEVVYYYENGLMCKICESNLDLFFAPIKREGVIKSIESVPEWKA